MARAFWKGAISFGLVYIPVQLHTATRGATIDLDYLDRRDFAPVGYQRYNKRTGKLVEWKNIVRGYQYAKGRYVALADEDFRQANPKAAQTIEITSFTEAGHITPEFYETPYYVAPQKGGQKVYALLREALRRTEKVAVAHVVVRTRQHLAVLLPENDVLMLNTLRFAAEIRTAKQLGVEAPSAKSAGLAGKELAMAEKLIADMTSAWEPQQYKDSYRDDLMRRIHEKVRHKQTHELPATTAAPRPRKSAEVIDLVAVLRESLGHGRGGRRAASHKTTQKLGKRKSARA